ncbi:MAG: excinuclease ABC subunit UvrA [Candidatus Marinimicrobia bacterium]|nr:excinuclease ABC subunit UvrA [Candidatus Neomarinimicrobiota bacterium]
MRKNQNKIVVRGAREHNLKNIDVEIPRNTFVVITGLSGSGKSSLAFDTIYAEGQRRYVESLSAYARQFLGLMEKPDVDYIEGLSPAISIQQKAAPRNPRSTVGTITEIHDYLRLLYARVGEPYCWKCGDPIQRQTVQQIVDAVMKFPADTKLHILAPVVRGRKGQFKEVFREIKRKGFLRVRVDGKIRGISDKIILHKDKKHNIEVVVDRIVLENEIKERLTESIELALKVGSGLVIVNILPKDEHLFSETFACPKCGVSLEELSPRMFSFNSPYGACNTCDGLGSQMTINPDLVVPDKRKSLIQAAIAPLGEQPRGSWYSAILKSMAKHYGFNFTTPWYKLPAKARRALLWGTRGDIVKMTYKSDRFSGEYSGGFEGVINNLERRYHQTRSGGVRYWIEQYMSMQPCPDCHGARLRKESLAVILGGKTIGEVSNMSIKDVSRFFEELSLSKLKHQVAKQVLKELRERLQFLMNVGLDYLTLDRSSSTLSGGESQRIRLATQIGSQLVGVLYILDEPSIGLHQRDNKRLISTLTKLRDLGNTILVVEHDRETIESADYIIDMGPGAGESGGNIIFEGPPEMLPADGESITGEYIRGSRKIEVPAERRNGIGKNLILRGAKGNNMKNVNIEFPLGKFICVTGVSGSGKSTLVNETLYPILARELHSARKTPLRYDSIDGTLFLDKVVSINQSPIGRTPRSNPATYTGVFTHIRELYSKLPESKIRGYKPGRFSFNVKGGRCEVCRGDGIRKIEMHFLPDVYVQCEECKGLRYNRETLEITYKGKTIADVLNMMVDEVLKFFINIPAIKRKLTTLKDVGLGYIHLGQQATTLSGGEAQRVKLSTELSKIGTGRTIYILDEPTTGLHFEDVRMLLNVLNRLVEKGNTVIVIEHNLDVIKTADWIIDLGPEGGDEGGRIVSQGTPEDVAKVKNSYTGLFLKKILE